MRRPGKPLSPDSSHRTEKRNCLRSHSVAGMIPDLTRSPSPCAGRFGTQPDTVAWLAKYPSPVLPKSLLAPGSRGRFEAARACGCRGNSTYKEASPNRAARSAVGICCCRPRPWRISGSPAIRNHARQQRTASLSVALHPYPRSHDFPSLPRLLLLDTHNPLLPYLPTSILCYLLTVMDWCGAISGLPYLANRSL